MDSSKSDSHLLDELLGIDPRSFDEEERTLVLPRTDSPESDGKQANAQAVAGAEQSSASEAARDAPPSTSATPPPVAAGAISPEGPASRRLRPPPPARARLASISQQIPVSRSALLPQTPPPQTQLAEAAADSVVSVAGAHAAPPTAAGASARVATPAPAPVARAATPVPVSGVGVSTASSALQASGAQCLPEVQSAPHAEPVLRESTPPIDPPLMSEPWHAEPSALPASLPPVSVSHGDSLLRGGADDPLIGELLDGRYRVLRLLGIGGIGIVYLCRHELLEKPVALKVLRPEYVLHEDLNARFLNEARAASAIKSPRIVDTLDVGTLPSGAPYFVMEYVEGETLASLLDREGSVSIARALDVARQLAEGLEAAHAAGVVHRDLKPENVFLALRPEGLFAKIFDFGIAKVLRSRKRLTYAGAVFGTPHYMSPEQARGEEVDARSDLYALGVMLFEMITGRVPFDGEDPLAVMSQHVDRVPPLMSAITAKSIPAELEAIVARCLAKDPRHRYAGASEFLRDVASLPPLPTMDALPPVRSADDVARASARLPSLAQSRAETLHAHVVPVARQGRRNRWFLAGAALGFAALGAFLAVKYAGFGAADGSLSAAQAAARLASSAEHAPAPQIGAAEPDVREVHFVLSPIDSHLFRGEEDLGPMPVSVKVAEGSPVTLTVRRKGYSSRKIVVDGSETRIVVGLVRAEAPITPVNKSALPRRHPSN